MHLDLSLSLIDITEEEPTHAKCKKLIYLTLDTNEAESRSSRLKGGLFLFFSSLTNAVNPQIQMSTNCHIHMPLVKSTYIIII